MAENHIFVQLRSRNGDEMRVQGPPELVNRFMQPYFTGDGGGSNAVEIVAEGDADKMQALAVASAVTPSKEDKPDFLRFYRFAAPQNQTEQILVITYYYQRHGGLESLSLDDYEKAYDLLQRVPVEKPSNMKSSVRNVVDRTKYLRNFGRGSYMLTMTGEEQVEALLAEKQSVS